MGNGYYDTPADEGPFNPYAGVLDLGELLGPGAGFGIEGRAVSDAATAVEVQFVPNPNIAKILMTNPVVIQGIGKYVETAEKIAKGIAPVGKVDDGFGQSPGTYRDSISHSTSVVNGQLQGILFSKDPKAVWIEFGTRLRPQNAFKYAFPAFAVLRRALQSTTKAMQSREAI